jgi:putative tryptophan/tyrosine transport system substrate-binding protein
MGADMQRREFITLLGGAAAAWPLAARAQQAARIYRLGTLTAGLPISANSPLGAVLLGELTQRGYILGQNLAFDARAAGGEKSRLPQLLLDFQASGVDVIVAAGYPTAVAAKTAGVPTVVAFGAGDPSQSGRAREDVGYWLHLQLCTSCHLNSNQCEIVNRSSSPQKDMIFLI